MAAVDLDAALDAAVAAARAAGALIARAWALPGGAAQAAAVKSSHADLVTETDKACEDVIRGMLAGAFPSYRFVGEESAAAAGGEVELTDEPTWMVGGRGTFWAACSLDHAAACAGC